MAIDDELKAQILRYHFVEHWRVGTIASQLGVHHSTVERVLGERTLAVEQAQVDWAHFGKLTIGRAERPLMAFVLVLSYSRYPFVRFYLKASLANLIRGHVEAFSVLGGTARVLLYDNMKSVVLERRGDAIRFHPTLLELAAHYRFEPRPVAPARGNEKSGGTAHPLCSRKFFPGAALPRPRRPQCPGR